MVVIFSTSLLEQLPVEQAIPRLTALLSHEVPEVRAEAAMVFARIDAPLDFASGVSVARRLSEEDVPFVIGALLDTIGSVGGGSSRPASSTSSITRTRTCAEPRSSRWASSGGRARTTAPGALLRSDDSEDRMIGAGAVGDLKAVELKEELGEVLVDAESRPTALEALVKLGDDAVPIMTDVLSRRDLPLPLRRTVVTALAAVGGPVARQALLDLIDDSSLSPAALTSLARLRAADRIDPIQSELLRDTLITEMQRGLRLAGGRSDHPESGLGPHVTPSSPPSCRVCTSAPCTGCSASWGSRTTPPASVASPRRSSATTRHGVATRSSCWNGTISATTSKIVMPYMDVVAEGMPLARVVELLDDATTLQRNPAEALLEEPEWWPRALGLHMLGRDGDISTPGSVRESLNRRRGK